FASRFNSPMKTNCLLTVGAALLLLSFTAAPLRGENARFRERLAAWESPQGPRETAARSGGPNAWEEDASAPATVAGPKSRFVEESVDEWTANGGFPGGCGESWCTNWWGDSCGPRFCCIRKEGLLFWAKGRSLPPL